MALLKHMEVHLDFPVHLWSRLLLIPYHSMSSTCLFLLQAQQFNAPETLH
jgi:hypothetical protein